MKVATLCYVFRHGQVLLIRGTKKYAPHYGVWNGLGGKVEVGETPEACVRREVAEEGGIILGNVLLLGRMLVSGLGPEPWLVHVFISSDFTGEVEETVDFGWFDLEEGWELPLLEADRRYLLPAVFARAVFSACFVYQHGVLVGGFLAERNNEEELN